MGQFSESKTSCMKDCVKPSNRENNAEHTIFYAGTNDVRSEKTSQVFAELIVDLAKSVTNDNIYVTIFSMDQRNNQRRKKVIKVNKVLLNLCKGRNILFNSRSAIDAKKNLNTSNLHLNITVSRKL